MTRLNSITFWCLVAVVCVFSGCGGNEVGSTNLVDDNIKKARMLYGLYASHNGFAGPKSKEQLLQWLSTDATAKVKAERLEIDLDKVEEYFVSERDGEPFEIRWGVSGMEDHPVIFEKTGVDGKRMVAFSPPRELDETEYKAYWTGKKKADPINTNPEQSQ